MARHLRRLCPSEAAADRAECARLCEAAEGAQVSCDWLSRGHVTQCSPLIGPQYRDICTSFLAPAVPATSTVSSLATSAVSALTTALTHQVATLCIYYLPCIYLICVRHVCGIKILVLKALDTPFWSLCTFGGRFFAFILC